MAALNLLAVLEQDKRWEAIHAILLYLHSDNASRVLSPTSSHESLRFSTSRHPTVRMSAIGTHQLWVGVGLALNDLQLVSVGLFRPDHNGRNKLARTTPVGPEVYQNLIIADIISSVCNLVAAARTPKRWVVTGLPASRSSKPPPRRYLALRLGQLSSSHEGRADSEQLWRMTLVELWLGTRSGGVLEPSS
eukprot:scaffold853_cov386-Prasinococcus_capsulatus_cf.AAC.25